jgi:uncharacterized membrane protein YfcA
MNPYLYYGGAVLVGFLTSILSGALGVGGAILTTPALRLILNSPATIALGTTLPATIPTALSGAYRYWKQGLVDFRIFGFSALFGTVGSLIGSYATRFFSGTVMMIFTAGFLLLVALNMFWKQNVKTETVRALRVPWWQISLIGLAAGLLSGFLGIGGGILMVPAYLLILHMPVKMCLGTSLLVISVIAIPGTIVHGMLGHIDWWLALALSILTFPGATLGAKLALRTRDQKLIRAFAILLFLVSIFFAYREIAGLF